MKDVSARVSATRRKLSMLALGQAYWPLFVFVCLYLAMAVSGLLDRLEGPTRPIATLFFFAGVIILALRGMRLYTRPSEREAERALDDQSDMRPISALSDRPADPSRGAQSLWTSHRARLLEELKRLKPPSLKPQWKKLDPFLMRAVLPSALACLAIVAWTDAPGRVMRALSPDYGALVGADDMVVEAWITPPEHTGRAPIFLKRGLEGVRVPKGSEITLRTQAHSAPKLVLRGKKKITQKFVATPDGAFEAKAKVMEDSEVKVKWWGVRAAWTLLASPDDIPDVRFVSMPFIGPQDRIEFTWAAADDYGVKTLELAISLQEPDAAAPEAEDRVTVSMPGINPLEATDDTQLDLTRHRWAGLPVNLRLVGTDGAGQEGTSETVPFILPEKLFLDPIARAAQEVRVTVLREPRAYKDMPKNDGALQLDALNTAAASRLDFAPPGVQRAALMLDALTMHGERYVPDFTIFLTLRTAHSMLESSATKPEADAVDPLLWALALKTEYGSTADALRRLEAAKKALEQALRDGASEAEIKRRMEAFRDAANQYLAAKMAEAIANGTQDAPQENQDGEAQAGGQGLGGQDFEDMLNALQDLTETGASDQARQLLSDITNMLENLEFEKGNGQGKGMPGMPGEQAENNEDELPSEEQELTEAMKRLSDILREQRELNDDTLAQQRGERPGEQQSGEGQEPGEQSGEQQGGQEEAGQQPGQQQGGQDGQQGQQQAGQQPGGQQGDTGDQPGAGEQAGNETQGEGGGGQQAQNEDTGQGAGTAPGETLAERQARLGELVERFAREEGIGEGAGENALEGRIDPDALQGIREAQRRAARSLERGDERGAARNQERATGLLSEIARGIASDLDDLEEARTGEQRNAGAEDPFGRPTGGAGNNGNDIDVPEASERQRAKDILEELRRRYGEAEDEEEREYLRRLLDRF